MRTSLVAALLAFFGAQSAPRPQTFAFKAVGDCRIRADVYCANSPGPRPAILWIHGGALIFGDRDKINRRQLAQYLDAGFTVVSIDYRLAPETKLPSILEDVSDAYRWMRERGPSELGIDPGRIAVIGHSAGGYLTLTCGYRLSPRPRALVSFYGYGDIVGDWYSKPDPFYSRERAVSRAQAVAGVGKEGGCEDSSEENRWPFYLYCRQQGLWPREVAGIDPVAEPRRFDSFCPIRNVTREYPPTMLLHGDKDTDVPFQQSAEMDRALTKAGIVHEFVPIAGGEHGFDHDMDDPRTVKAFEKVMSFLKSYLAGQSRPLLPGQEK
jgi:acetyl esterase/lipase